MKSSTRDQAEGKLRQVKGKARQIAGKMFGDSELEVEGKEENDAGKVQEKTGAVKRILGK